MFDYIKKKFQALKAEANQELAPEYTSMFAVELEKIVADEIIDHQAICTENDEVLKSAFPDDVKPPEILSEFAQMARITPWGALGCFNLTPETINDLLPVGGDLNNEFAMFIHTPDGGQAGLWLKDERNSEKALFVFMDSEGAFEVLAPNFVQFLYRLTHGKFSEGFSDFLPIDQDDNDSPTEVSKYYTAWLEDHPIIGKQFKAAALIDFDSVDDGSAQIWLAKYLDDTQSSNT